MPRFFVDFPYTNMNDLNLDWMIEVLREMQGEIDSLEARVAALEGGDTP